MIWLFVCLLAVLAVARLLYYLFMSPTSQVFGKFPYKVETKEKLVALTFDDGPNEPFTSDLLDFLDSQKIKATFFQVGACVQRWPEATRKIHASGHTIGIHSWSHQFSKYFTQPSFKREITDARDIITKTIGKEPTLFRPPWLVRHPWLLGRLKREGLHPVSGLFCSNREVLQIDAKTIARETLAKVKPGVIIIFHDGYDAKGGNRRQTVAAVKLVVKDLQQQGYHFVTADTLLGLKPYR